MECLKLHFPVHFQNLDSLTLNFLMPHVCKADASVNIKCPRGTEDRHSRKQNGCLVVSAIGSVQWASHALQGKDHTAANV